jgi:hypothetical protein
MKTEARQSFSHGFVLTEQELRRIADVATQQLVKVRPSPPPKTQIELRFRNGTITESARDVFKSVNTCSASSLLA